MKKITKTQASYDLVGTLAKHCGNCVMFLTHENRCTLVKGEIMPTAVCKYWEAKK